MAHKTNYNVPRRRVRDGKTNYKKRLIMLKGRLSRLVVRRSNCQIVMQIVNYEPAGDRVIAQANSAELLKQGWPVCNANMPEAYLTGLLLAKKAKDVEGEVVLDLGLFSNIAGSRLYAAVKGAVDGGLKVLTSEESFPAEERINGQHIAAYAEKLHKEDAKKYEAYFSRYLKAKADPAKLPEIVAKVKAKIA